MHPKLLFIGGTFDTCGGRPSGYFGKLADAVHSLMPHATLAMLNGGSFDALVQAVESMRTVTHLFWFADVPNELPKLLPGIHLANPGMVLIGSKNNRKNLYNRSALYERMRLSGSEFLVEFREAPNGRLLASVLRCNGTVLVDSSLEITAVAQALAAEFVRLNRLQFPLHKVPYSTSDSYSYSGRDLAVETELPFPPHVGAFGVRRRKHIHEGVDLYAQPGDAVVAMEDGIVKSVLPFTGASMGSPWWNETSCVMVEGSSGVLNYGELRPAPGIAAGVRVRTGQTLGELLTVLTEDKGRPMTMLHLERYVAGTEAPILEWELDMEAPRGLRDPTVLLYQAADHAPVTGRS